MRPLTYLRTLWKWSWVSRKSLTEGSQSNALTLGLATAGFAFLLWHYLALPELLNCLRPKPCHHTRPTPAQLLWGSHPLLLFLSLFPSHNSIYVFPCFCVLKSFLFWFVFLSFLFISVPIPCSIPHSFLFQISYPLASL